MAFAPPKGPPDEENVRMYKMQVEGEDSGGGGDDDYDPHEHRKPENPTTSLETFIHLLKGSLGTGILAMPKAFYNSGLLVGSIGTILIGTLCTYCLHLLVKSQYTLCKRFHMPVLNYPDSMVKAFMVGPEFLRPMAKASGIIVDVFLIVYQMGICCVYIVFIAENLREVIDTTISKRLWMLIILAPLILINFIRNLKKLAPLSAFANLITFVGLIIIIYFIFEEKLFQEDRPLAGELKNFPLFVGTTLFALEAVGVVIALENNMKTPKSFGGTFGVLNASMSIIVFLYWFIGFFGYVRYGVESKDTVTLNLQQNAPTTIAVQVIFCIAILITYALQSYVPVEIIWYSYLGPALEKNPRKTLYEYLLRTSLVLITFLLAVAVPNLEVFISLFGALCLSVLGISMPGLMDICTRWPDRLGRWNWILWKDIFLIVAGLLALVSGTITSLSRIAPEDIAVANQTSSYLDGDFLGSTTDYS